jgi:hypothetical protein
MGLSQYKRINNEQKIQMSDSLASSLGLIVASADQDLPTAAHHETPAPQPQPNVAVMSQPSSSVQEIDGITVIPPSIPPTIIPHSSGPLVEAPASPEIPLPNVSLDELEAILNQRSSSNQHTACCLSFGATEQNNEARLKICEHADKVIFLNNCSNITFHI